MLFSGRNSSVLRSSTQRRNILNWGIAKTEARFFAADFWPNKKCLRPWRTTTSDRMETASVSIPSTAALFLSRSNVLYIEGSPKKTALWDCKSFKIILVDIMCRFFFHVPSLRYVLSNYIVQMSTKSSIT